MLVTPSGITTTEALPLYVSKTPFFITKLRFVCFTVLSIAGVDCGSGFFPNFVVFFEIFSSFDADLDGATADALIFS